MVTSPGRSGVGISPRAVHLAIRGMQASIAVLVVVGVVIRHTGVIVNASLALLVTFVPAALRRDRGVTLPQGITLWVTVAVLLHSLGMVWFYTAVWWWDHLTHAVSASLVAGAGYAVARALDRHSEAVHFPDTFLFVYVLVFTMGLGVLWEVVEFLAREVGLAFGFDLILVQYGLGDTMLDLLFDLFGAALFATFGGARATAIVDSAIDRLERDDASGD